MSTVAVAGPVANRPGNGGIAWVPMSYVRGLVRLGVDTMFVEEVSPRSCVDELGAPAPLGRSVNLRWFRDVVEFFGVADRAGLVCGGETWGTGFDELREILASSSLLLNISGNLGHRELRRVVRRAAYLDLDPGYTQMWEATGIPGARLEGHDVYFTVGLETGTEACSIPMCGLDWRRTLPPVVLDDWPVAPPPEPERFTTVASWRGAYGPVEHLGTTYGQKVHQFRRFAELPRHAPGTYEIALEIQHGDRADRELMEAAGWRVVDPSREAGDPGSFRSYVQRSGAEFSVAQDVYVRTRSGWFSDRTARYLASGRPALVQDTGFGAHVPTGEGLLSFAALEEAVAGVQRIVRDYRAHAEAARSVAEEHLEATRVLSRLLEEAEIS